jgi:AcrR family transcriptional regulator
MSANTRSLILDAAAHVFAEKGFGEASVEDIAVCAGVAKGSIFYNFGSKVGLYEQLVAQGFSDLTKGLREAAEAAGGAGGEQALWAMTRRLLEEMAARPDLATVMAVETIQVKRGWREATQSVRDEAVALFADAFRPSVPPEGAMFRATSVFGAVLLAGLEWTIFDTEQTLDHVHSQVWACVRSSLTP